jgi:hypothetical protein
VCARMQRNRESARHTRLVAKWERPIIVRIVIDNNKVISKTRSTYNWEVHKLQCIKSNLARDTELDELNGRHTC